MKRNRIPNNLTAHMQQLYQAYGMHSLLIELEAICVDAEERSIEELHDWHHDIAESIRCAMDKCRIGPLKPLPPEELLKIVRGEK
jgi:hypothetical protein